jgi:BirA family transcriptional regulator, biotin operon repressor / biotin---[acetyl-CoA-carboxylase] ligase
MVFGNPTPLMPPDIAAAFAAALARDDGMPLDGRWFPSVGSTMDVAEEAAEAGAGEGLVIVAGEQTRGRGRRGRVWSSPPGAGLYLSFLFRPPADAAPCLSLLTLAAGVAVQCAVARASGLTAQLKWPNDVMVGRRKLAGILAEGLGVGGPAPSIILGIGINLRRSSHPEEIAERMTSLEDELAHIVPQGLVLEEILVQVRRIYDELRRGEADDILRAWRQTAPSAEGSPVEWQTPQGSRHGITAGIDSDGALLVRTPEGVERIVGGEVIWK